MLRLLLMMGCCVSLAQAKTFVLRAADLEMRGGWRQVKDEKGKGAREFLHADGSTFRTPAAGAVEIPHAGKWRVWVRGRDFANDRPGIRWFTLRLGEKTLERKFGTHAQAGDEGWAWENGGEIELAAGPLLVVLGEACRDSARFESVLFTDNMNYVPEGVSWELRKERAKVVPLAAPENGRGISEVEPLGEMEEKPVAEIADGDTKVSFHRAGAAVAVKLWSRGAETWEAAGDPQAAVWTVIARPEGNPPVMRKGDIYPDWDASQSPLQEFTVGNAKVKTRRSNVSSAPWEAGQCVALRPSAARQADGKSVELEFARTPWGTLRSVWAMAGKGGGVRVKTVFQPAKPGHFSLGFHAPFAVKPEEADSWLLPFQFQDGRFPAKPVLIVNATTPTPLVLVEERGVSCVLSAEPDAIPYEWQTGDSSRYGFGLRNEQGAAQPMIYAPVMGLSGSGSKGGTVEASFRLRVGRGGWYGMYRSVADGDFKVRDYRRPTSFSMTDTVWNLIDLIRDEKAAGWDAAAKGSVQIESRNTVTQAAPLAYMSLYLLTGDEDLYRRFARPSLEFMLSRPSTHFAVEREIGDRYYRHQPMRGPVATYGAGVFASAHAMTHGRSPAFAEACFSGGKPRPTRGGHVQGFDDLVMLHRITGDKKWLDEAVAAADLYLERLKQRRALGDPGDHAFVNNGYVPNWEGLLYLAETTGEARFRDAAVEGARRLLTLTWTQPVIPDGDVTLNPGGVYNHARGIWWWGDGKKRLGVYEGPASEGPVRTEPPAIPEREVPAWTVSNIGLGLEHPFTYVRRAGQANILMSNWAPNLLRLAALSGDDAFRMTARNAMIGRYANYPGYYLDGRTDEFRRADYPSEGPDITSLYLHHIPAFAASVVDYLFTDAEVRSGGKVVFPALRQFGYVWFDNRVWGHAPGSVYGEEAWPWLHRTAAKADDPSVDVLLAQGGGRFHVVLLNQTPEERSVNVALDAAALGRDLEGARVSLHRENRPAGGAAVEDGRVKVTLAPRGITALTLEGVEIDVPTQRVKPPESISLPETGGTQAMKIEGSPWTATAAGIEAPPFATRDFFVWLDAGLGSLKSARLVFRLKDGVEKTVEKAEFPYEFTVTLPAGEAVEWRVEVALPDGGTAKSGISRHGG